MNPWTICYSYQCIFLVQINSVARLALTSLESGFHLYRKMAILGQNKDPSIQLSCLEHSSSRATLANLASTASFGNKFHTLNVKYLQLRVGAVKLVLENVSLQSSFHRSWCLFLFDNTHCKVPTHCAFPFPDSGLSSRILAECTLCNCKAVSRKHCNVNMNDHLFKCRIFRKKRSTREVLEQTLQQKDIMLTATPVCWLQQHFLSHQRSWIAWRCLNCSIITRLSRPT